MTAPRVAVIVANAVSGDSRVIKTAASARRMGADVLIIGTSTTSRREDSVIGDIPVIRVVAAPSGTAGKRVITRSGASWRVRPWAPIAFSSAEEYSAGIERRTRRRAATRTSIDGVKARLRQAERWDERLRLRLALDARRVRSLVLDAWFVARRRGYVRPPIVLGPTPKRSELEALLVDRLPFVAGYVASMTPVLEEFEPDLVHAHDVFMAAVGAAYAARSAEQGRRIPWIYDAHEWVAGLRAERAIAKTIAADELELLVAPEADAIITVGEALASELSARFSLDRPPAVILNAPPQWSGAAGTTGGLRSEFGIDPDVPLLVYPGVVKPKRGIDTAVRALQLLGETHLALLADTASPHVADIVSLAEDLAVSDRLHVRAYVPPDEIAGFISDATIGIYPLAHYPNAEVALPTKLLEYVQARLPAVVSDTAEMASFVRRHGIGEVFVSGDHEDMARAVRQVLADRDRYVGRYSADLVSDHTWERQEEQLRSVYSTVLARELGSPDGPFQPLRETPPT